MMLFFLKVPTNLRASSRG